MKELTLLFRTDSGVTFTTDDGVLIKIGTSYAILNGRTISLKQLTEIVELIKEEQDGTKRTSV